MRRGKKMTERRGRTKRARRRRERGTSKPSQCFNLDCTGHRELFSRLENSQFSSYLHYQPTCSIVDLHLLNNHTSVIK